MKIKRSRLLIILLLMPFLANAQRYLTPVFETTTINEDVIYGNAMTYDGLALDLKLDFYQPTGDTEMHRPLVIYVHGGGFTDEAQTKDLVHIEAYCDSLSRRGYTAASINYRLDSTISNRAVNNAIHDARAAVRYFKANADLYKIDTTLIFIAGESAGAVTALGVNYINELAEVEYPPTPPEVTDFSVEGSSGYTGFSSRTKATLCLCGGTETVVGDLMFDTLAIQGSADPPLLMVHGTSDPLIPIARALDLAVRADHVDLPYLFFTLPEATHCPWFFPLEDSWEYLDTLIDYTVPFLYACATEPSSVEEEESPTLTIYPNPTNDLFRVVNLDGGVWGVLIYDLSGKVVWSGDVKANDMISVSELDSGLYMVHIPDKNRVMRLVVE